MTDIFRIISWSDILAFFCIMMIGIFIIKAHNQLLIRDFFYHLQATVCLIIGHRHGISYIPDIIDELGLLAKSAVKLGVIDKKSTSYELLVSQRVTEDTKYMKEILIILLELESEYSYLIKDYYKIEMYS